VEEMDGDGEEKLSGIGRGRDGCEGGENVVV
jgi:hypothetical protein